MTEARCAFDRCQAGGVILPGAPRVDGSLRPDWPPDATYGPPAEYHPGCWAAERRAEAAERCRCVSDAGAQCLNLPSPTVLGVTAGD